MHEMSVIWLRVAAALYAVGLIHAILTILRRRAKLFRLAFITFCGGLSLHFVSIVEEVPPRPRHDCHTEPIRVTIREYP